MLNIKNYFKASTLEEAYELNQNKANVIVGGMLWLKMQDRNINTAIDLSGLGLDAIEEKADYKAWFCGHWHTDKRIDRMHFLFDGFECAEDLSIPVEPDDETFEQVARDILDRHKEAFKKLGE